MPDRFHAIHVACPARFPGFLFSFFFQECKPQSQMSKYEKCMHLSLSALQECVSKKRNIPPFEQRLESKAIRTHHVLFFQSSGPYTSNNIFSKFLQQEHKLIMHLLLPCRNGNSLQQIPWWSNFKL